jgi:AraC-like DNA-binding protein
MPSSFRAGTGRSKQLSATKHIEERVVQSNPPTDELQQERVCKILETIKSGRLCSLHGLADEFNLSKSYLQHVFKRQTGLRLGRLIVEQKLKRAAHLLQSSNLRIKEIASAVGYEHTSSFIRAFERRFSEAPQTYRHHCNRSKC